MISIRNWFMRLIGKEVEAFGYNIPANFKRACPGNASGVYWEMPDGTYWFTAISGTSIQIDDLAYERGTWFKSMMEIGEGF
jgi:hypothetical protein|nr:MAG TPA: protein of unknown function (DUF2093) [Caudoviricetes sp.]